VRARPGFWREVWGLAACIWHVKGMGKAQFEPIGLLGGLPMIGFCRVLLDSSSLMQVESSECCFRFCFPSLPVPTETRRESSVLW
jgi:hypothetical protein